MSRVVSKICDMCKNICKTRSIELPKGLHIVTHGLNPETPLDDAPDLTPTGRIRRRQVPAYRRREPSDKDQILCSISKNLDFCCYTCLDNFILERCKKLVDKVPEVQKVPKKPVRNLEI
jgi:hypothetical protein